MITLKKNKSADASRRYFRSLDRPLPWRKARREVRTVEQDGRIVFCLPDDSLCLVRNGEESYLYSLSYSSDRALSSLLSHALVWARMAGGGELFAVWPEGTSTDELLRQGFRLSGRVLDESGQVGFTALSLSLEGILPTQPQPARQP